MRQIIKKVLPSKAISFARWLLYCWQIFLGYMSDMRKYVKCSYVGENANLIKIESIINTRCHMMEKGITMPQRTANFGAENYKRLHELLRSYCSRNMPKDTIAVKAAVHAITEYNTINQDCAHKQELPADLLANADLCGINSYEEIDKKELIAMSQGDFSQVAKSRFSIRDFDDRPVDLETIEQSVQIAMKTPSVCNRQCARVYLIADKTKMAQVLSLQNGNRGFGHLFDKVILLAADLRAFEGSKERNQAYVDGGLFAMSLMYSLHYMGLGSCALNWCVDRHTDRRLRRIAQIDDAHVVLMVLGVGHLKEKFMVAQSNRKNVSEVLKIV